MRRTGAFLAGLSVGAALVANWRPIAKGTVKAGIRGGATVRASAARAAENLADVVQEATWEMGAGGDASAAAPAPGAAAPTAAGRNGDGTAVAAEATSLS